MREDECALLREQLVLLHPELLQELAPGHSEDGFEQTAAEHVGGFVARQAVVALGDVAVAEPPGGEEEEERESGTDDEDDPKSNLQSLLRLLPSTHLV